MRDGTMTLLSNRCNAGCVERRGVRMVEATSDIDIDAPADVVFAVLWDAARYPDFMTDMVDASVQPGGSETEQIVVNRVQFIRSRTYSIRMRAESPLHISWALIEGENMNINEGFWRIDPVTEGTGCHLTYLLRIDLAIKLPQAIASRLASFNMPTMMRQVKARAEHQYRLRLPA